MGSPMPSAVICAGKQRAVSDSDGKFLIKGINTWFWGRICRIKVKAEGYEKLSKWIYVRRGRTYRLDFKLVSEKERIFLSIKSPQNGYRTKEESIHIQVLYRSKDLWKVWRKANLRVMDICVDGEVVISFSMELGWKKRGECRFSFSEYNEGEHKLQVKVYRDAEKREEVGRTDIVRFVYIKDKPVITVSESSLKGRQIYTKEAIPEICVLEAISNLDIVVKVDGEEVVSGYDKTKRAIVCKLSERLKDGRHQVVVEEIKKKRDKGGKGKVEVKVKGEVKVEEGEAEGTKEGEGGIEGSSGVVTFAFLKDTIFPSITNMQPEEGSIITKTKPAISCEYTDNGSGIDDDSVKLVVDAEDVSLLSSITSSGLNYIPNKDLEDGEHGIIIEVTDKAGNRTEVSWRFTVNTSTEVEDSEQETSTDTEEEEETEEEDTEEEETEEKDAVAPEITNVLPKDESLISTNKPEVAATFSDAATGIDKDTIILKLDDTEVTASYDETTRKISYTPEIVLEDGTHTVFIEVKDRAGNEATVTSTFRVETDTTLPVISNLTPADNSIIDNSTPEISAIVNDTESGVDPSSIAMKVDENTVTHFYDSTTGKVSYMPEIALADGAHTSSIEVKDKSGNKVSAEVSFTVDTTVPEIEITSHKDGDIVIGDE